MVVHRFAKHYLAILAVRKAISTTPVGCKLFSQKCRYYNRVGRSGPLSLNSSVVRRLQLGYGPTLERNFLVLATSWS